MTIIVGLERQMYAIARRQHSVVSYDQLVNIGMSRWMIRQRVESGQLRPHYRETYIVGGVDVGPLQRASAAALHVAGAGVLTHHTGIAAWGLASEWPAIPRVLLPHDRRIRTDSRLKTHRTRRWEHVQPTTRLGLPVASIEHVLIMCAGESTRAHRTMLVDEALRQGLATEPALMARALDMRAPRVPGAGKVIRMLAARPKDTARMRSAMEVLMARTLNKGRLCGWETNAKVDTTVRGFEVDFLWRDVRVVLEVDGRQHDLEDQRIFDVRKDHALGEAGYRVVRTSYSSLADNPARLIADLRALGCT